MIEGGMEARDLLEALLELADRAELEVRVLSASTTGAEFRPTSSATCRVGNRIWVVLAPDDPPMHQASILAEALSRFRGSFLEGTFVSPAVRSFIEDQSAPGDAR